MSELVANCPRCGANKITFDLKSATKTVYQYDWQYTYEAFCICRQCYRSSIFVLSESVHSDYKYVHKTGLVNIEGAVNRFMNIEGVITLKDSAATKPPEYIPEQIDAVFREGATCLSVGCNNAAGTMFRLSIDMVTSALLPEEETEGLNRRIRRNLGLRLPWMFDNGLLPITLRELSTCVREDGNDGAHAGTLTKKDAEDLMDFTIILLERIYTEPERLRLAQERRLRRRSQDG